MTILCPVYCINLEHRADRRAHSRAQFALLSISPDRVIYLPFAKDIRGGAYGCFDSHMRVWAHFLETYPKSQCCLIFEDDFAVNHASKCRIMSAARFLTRHETHVDILFLHDICMPLSHQLNNKHFIHGLGLTTSAYVIHRNYIQSIVDKHGRLPEANGRHLDNEINFLITKNDNCLHTSRLFFTRQVCIEQIADESDNYLHSVDRILRMNVNQQCRMIVNIIWRMRALFGLSVMQTKYLSCMLASVFSAKYLM